MCACTYLFDQIKFSLLTLQINKLGVPITRLRKKIKYGTQFKIWVEKVKHECCVNDKKENQDQPTWTTTSLIYKCSAELHGQHTTVNRSVPPKSSKFLLQNLGLFFNKIGSLSFNEK